MKVCEWNSDYSVGINELDSHHKKLFDILDGLFTLMSEGAEDKSIIKVLDEFLDYTHYHFDEEEKIMSKMGYPDIEQHKRLHRELIQTLKEFQSSAQNGMAIFVATKVANTGMEWLKNHILTVDHKYYDYMKKQGLQF
jgi:hemerythrin-like metal-binding protein